MKYIVFYSWQSDTDSKYNRNYIRNLLDSFSKSYSPCSIEISESVGNKPGSPNIADTIIAKIDKANIFVCDLTPIKELNGKQLPNPNVLFELGYAVCRLGWERIICVVNTVYGDIDKMPFDIRQNRISHYKYSDKCKSELNLYDFLVTIISNYEDIENRFNSSSIKAHDIQIFEKFKSVVNEKEFMDGLWCMRQNFIHTGYDTKLWNNAIDFTDYPDNRYIIEEVNLYYENFVKSVCIMKNRLSLIMFVSHNWQCLDPLTEHTHEEIDENLREKRFGLHNIICYEDIPEKSDEYWNRIENNQSEIRSMIDDVIHDYKVFRDTIKRHLFI